MTTIILNKDAVDTLFPEGSEARVVLQKSVLEQLVKQSIKAPEIGMEVQKEITRAQEALRQQCLVASTVMESGRLYGNLKLSEKMRQMIMDEVAAVLMSTVKEKVQTVKDEIEVIVSRQIESHLSVTVRKALEEAMKANTVLSSLASIASGKTA